MSEAANTQTADDQASNGRQGIASAKEKPAAMRERALCVGTQNLPSLCRHLEPRVAEHVHDVQPQARQARDSRRHTARRPDAQLKQTGRQPQRGVGANAAGAGHVQAR